MRCGSRRVGCESFRDAEKSPRGVQSARSSREWIDTLVLAIRSCRDSGDTECERNLSNSLMGMLMPQLRQVAGQFEKSRGSLSREDLVQVAAIEAVKAIETYQRSKRGGQSFGTWVVWRARRAIMDQIRLHRADMCLPDRAQRGKGKWQRSVDVVSRDAPEQSHATSATRSQDAASALEADSIEDVLIAHERCVLVQRALSQMEPQLEELIARVYGIGLPRESTRAVAARWCMSRRRLDELLAQAHDELRERLGECLR